MKNPNEDKEETPEKKFKAREDLEIEIDIDDYVSESDTEQTKANKSE